MYGLRKIHKHGKHHNLQWPLEVGAVVKCPDWNPEPECGGGLHLLPEAIGNYGLLIGQYWCVVEFDENQMVRIDHEKAKVPECKIVYLSKSRDGLKQYFDFDKFNPESAYGWARDIGDKEIMRDKITDSRWAYHWARHIGDREIMIDRVTDGLWACYWAYNIGDVEIMRDRITDSASAYHWARNIGDREIMRDKITDSHYAYLWARYIGDMQIMRDKITDSEHAYLWAWHIGNKEIMRKRITDPYWIGEFNYTFGEKPCTD